MTLASGTVQSGIRDLVEEQLASGRQIGIQVGVYQGSDPVVDIAAGVMGPEDPRPVQADSLFCSFSVTKGVAALAVHILAEKGQIDYDAPVVSYWPEFAPNGKERLTVAQALSHQAGLHAMPSPFKPEHITDWDAGIRRMEQGVPAWEPGTATGYHAVTFGWIVGGIVQGATGRHIKDVIREEIAEPLGIADEFFVGIPDGVDERLTTLEIAPAGEGAPIPADHDMFKAMPPPMWPHFNEMPFRQACLPSGNGHFTARALAKMYAALANGGEIDGVQLVPATRIPHMQRLMTEEVDRVLMAPIPKGIGFMFGGSSAGAGPMGPRRSAFGHPGAGGSIAFCDPEGRLSVAICINKMQNSAPGEGPTIELCNRIRELTGAA
jgi:CubicO group peptidase (beta-lactamase class C family)